MRLCLVQILASSAISSPELTWPVGLCGLVPADLWFRCCPLRKPQEHGIFVQRRSEGAGVGTGGREETNCGRSGESCC